ncbi:hypothetical protein Acr_07g0003960 [Actinidia rufa]|uniref:Uncharacterized protein n=1 Tax=Actinidia rufa TaxID=165716 RepID=A0A7J0EW37_9ERIC|nr:hypothetical protein Acr_07g0003960 [Actinidia rufa]
MIRVIVRWQLEAIWIARWLVLLGREGDKDGLCRWGLEMGCTRQVRGGSGGGGWRRDGVRDRGRSDHVGVVLRMGAVPPSDLNRNSGYDGSLSFLFSPLSVALPAWPRSSSTSISWVYTLLIQWSSLFLAGFRDFIK